jgi:hypothetical protein
MRAFSPLMRRRLAVLAAALAGLAVLVLLSFVAPATRSSMVVRVKGSTGLACARRSEP